SGDTLYLNPRNPATRAECATMFSKYLYLEPTYTINGNDLSLYTVVYPENYVKAEKKAAEYLRGHIEGSLGIALPVVSDATAETEYEILVGMTNREEKIDTSAFSGDNVFEVKTIGNKLLICGIDSNSSGVRFSKELKGSYVAVHYLLEEMFGVEFYDDEEAELIHYNPDPVISFDEGYFYTDEPFFDYRVFYMSGSILGQDKVKDVESQSFSNYLKGNFGSYEDNYNATPCLSSEENIETILNNLIYCVENSDARVAGLGINDSSEYCKCTTCAAMYREYGARSATVVNIANIIAKKLDELYPGFEVQLGAYTYTAKPPTGMTLEPNIIMEYITIEGCASHAYNDPNWSRNASMMKEMLGWYELTGGKLNFWDHSGAFVNFMTPFPDWDSQLTNVRLFADYSYDESGILMKSVFGGKHADFGAIRAYMFSLMYRDPYMTKEEYDYHLNKGLEAFYGAGWKEIRNYIDKITVLGNDKCHVFHANTLGWYDYDKVAASADELDALWESAASKTSGVQLERLTLARQSWIYLRQSATHNKKYVNGTEADKAGYVAANEALYNYIMENDVIWTEAVHGTLADCNFTKGPDSWQIGG
ncbi:MAG: DUF4838 domain-containing protein, partial [Clostridia bacterium]|nr:DUF4838 domain-containing protein [Clostridia bacterium]